MNIANHNFRQGLVPKRSGFVSALGFPLLMLALCVSLLLTYSIRFPTLLKGKGTVLRNDTCRAGFYIIASFNNEDLRRIRPGQTVWLLLKGYLPGKWGRIHGRVEGPISADPNIGNVIIRLPNGLVTDRNKPISFESGLNGDVLIVEKDISLLQKMF